MKLTKNELRNQQVRLSQFQKYLPTLQLKKAMLQFEVSLAQTELSQLLEELQEIKHKIEDFSFALSDTVLVDLKDYSTPLSVKKTYENVAGVEIPIFDKVTFKSPEYAFFDTPVWTDSALETLREFTICGEKISIAREKRRALEKELRSVSIRVNLFEKVLIPKSKANIKKIQIFLSDQQLAAVAQAKVAKKKIALKREGG